MARSAAFARAVFVPSYHRDNLPGDINDASQPLAHAAVLVQYLNRMFAALAGEAR